MSTRAVLAGLAVLGALVSTDLVAGEGAAEEPGPPARVALAGARSSHYGIRPFPGPEEWVRALRDVSGRFEGSVPTAIWIVGGLHERKGCRLEFPGEGAHPGIAFLDHDKHAPYLDAFDRAGIRVFLQVEPGLADPDTLIDLVLSRYRHHPSVAGFGVDVEWYRESEVPGWGTKVDDETARRWEARVKAHRPEYRLFLKHWDPRWMPPRHRGDILFVDDSQELAGLDAMREEFAAWGKAFAPNPVVFQVGYRSDRPWWGALADPVVDIGRAVCARIAQDCGVAWVDFTLREVMPAGVFAPVEEAAPPGREAAPSPAAGTPRLGAPGSGPVIGVKIYEPVADRGALFGEWKRLGIDTAFVSAALARTGAFIPEARQAGIRTLVITPVFFDPEHLAAHPDDWALTGRGARAKQDWVEFVCPSREEYREKRRREALRLLEDHRPDGLSLDFVRHFVFWEMVRPEARVDPLDTTCFCPRCLARFQREAGVRIPDDAAASPGAAARWLFANHAPAWTRWRAGLVTSWVRDLVGEARRVKPDVLVGVHLVPWGRGDYDDGLLRVAGQDVEALAPLLDYVSPMCYAHMLYREPNWVSRVVGELAGRAGIPVLPSIEVKDSYRPEPLDEAFFGAALRAALAPPSRGVVFWSWPPLAEQRSKQEILVRERPPPRPDGETGGRAGAGSGSGGILGEGGGRPMDLVRGKRLERSDH